VSAEIFATAAKTAFSLAGEHEPETGSGTMW
jgi:hypothetical protein